MVLAYPWVKFLGSRERERSTIFYLDIYIMANGGIFKM